MSTDAKVQRFLRYFETSLLLGGTEGGLVVLRNAAELLPVPRAIDGAIDSAYATTDGRREFIVTLFNEARSSTSRCFTRITEKGLVKYAETFADFQVALLTGLGGYAVDAEIVSSGLSFSDKKLRDAVAEAGRRRLGQSIDEFRLPI